MSSTDGLLPHPHSTPVLTLCVPVTYASDATAEC